MRASGTTFLLRPCVASIRYWYPDGRIYLLKDYIKGGFSAEEFEQYWNVKTFRTERLVFGWGWSKLIQRRHRSSLKCVNTDLQYAMSIELSSSSRGGATLLRTIGMPGDALADHSTAAGL
ncbi:MAG: hypothetical protein ABIU86_15415 [Gemmatimonadaceae bacterium]